MSWLLGPVAIGAPLGLLGALGVPAVLAIHWFRRRSPPKTVTGLFLFPPPTVQRSSGRRRERLIASASLLLELIAVLAATWWLADVHPAGDVAGRQVLVLLDDRVRMTAVADDGSTAAQRAQVALDQRLASLDARDRVTLVRSGAIPVLMAGPAATVDEARRALATWRPTAAWHDLRAGVQVLDRLATAASGGTGVNSAERWVVSDREPEDLDAAIGVIARGRSVTNVGIASVLWQRTAAATSEERLIVQVVRHGDALVPTVLVRQGDTTVLRSASAETGATIITLPAALRAALPEDARLTVQLDRRDALPADDVAEVLRPRLRQVRVQVAMPERAGALRAAVLRAVAAVPETLLVDDATTAELVISADAASPADGPWRMHIAPAGTAASLGPYLMRAGHPLCRDADGTGVLWVGGMPRVALPADHSDVIAAGDLVLVSERRQGRNRTVMLHADPTVGTLVQHPLWPVLIANLIEARRDALPGVRDPNLSLGVASQAVLPLASTRAVLSDGISTVALAADGDGRVPVPPLERAGRWNVDATAAPATSRWAVPLLVRDADPRSGDCHGAITMDRPAQSGDQQQVERRRTAAASLVPLLLIAAAAVAAALLSARGR